MLNLDVEKIRSRLVWYASYKSDDVKKRIWRKVGLTAKVVVWAFIYGNTEMREKIIARMQYCDFVGHDFEGELLRSLVQVYITHHTLVEADIERLYDIADAHKQELLRIKGDQGNPNIDYGFRGTIDQILALEPLD